MDRKKIANETLNIIKQGYYIFNQQKISIHEMQEKSINDSVLIPPDTYLLREEKSNNTKISVHISVENTPTVEAILNWNISKKSNIGVLNFASAKNPGGGFINGASAQEESLAASSGLYGCQCANPDYYSINRSCGTMIYTNYAIYSPNVVFFRDGRFRLLEQPVTASVLTLPAVNFGQVLQKGEDTLLAKLKMKERMQLALELFVQKGDRNLILGAYGCGVFRNDPNEIAHWWQELINDYYSTLFDNILFAVYDTSKNGNCINAFNNVFK